MSGLNSYVYVQDVDRLHREVNCHKSTVSAKGKEVERLQRENQTLQGEIETHRITVCHSYIIIPSHCIVF